MRKQLLFHFILLVLAACSTFSGYAQTDSVTVNRLNEAVINGKRRVGVLDMQQYSIGGTLYSADSITLATLRHASLTDYIAQLTPIYIRESGSGMMASVSLRGTSSSHTVVQWNSININSLTMGQVDFNHLPIFFFDVINVFPGGEGALYGNGSIGGSIALATNDKVKEGITLDIQQSVGSFGHTFTGGKFVVKKKTWATKTALLYNYSKNNFPFRNSEVHGFPQEKQNNSTYNNYGILQEVYYSPTQQSNLSFKAWFNGFYREIQPLKSGNNLPANYDTIRDRNLMTLVNYNHRADWAQISVSGAYVYDRQLFKNDVIATNRFVARAEVEKNIFKALNVKIGTYTEYIVPDVQSYESSVTEWRSDIYLLARYAITTRLDASINMRQSFVSRLNPPFTPSAGIAYKLVDNITHQLKFRVVASKSFRAPTLNDRYWGKSNNIYLKSEIGINTEGGVDYIYNAANFSLQAQSTVYNNNVDDWIRWLPRGSVWKPVNLGKVEVTGIDVGIKIAAPLGKFDISASANYAYVHSKIVKGTSETDPNVGKTLPLLPKHRWNFTLDGSYKNVFAKINLGYTGETYSTDRNMIINDYILTSLSAGYSLKLLNNMQKLTFLIQIQNLFDKEYESVKFFAMPGRNFMLSVRFSL